MKKVYKVILVIIIIFGLFLIFSDKLFLENNPFKQVYKVIVIPIEKISTEFNDLRTYKKIQKKQEYLEKQLIDYNNLKEKNALLEEEISYLKDLIEMEKTYTDYNSVYAKIISRNKLYFFDTFTIDKGSSSNINIKDAVLYKDGLIGRVISTSKNYSTVRMITSNYDDNKLSLSIKTKDGNVVGTIKEYRDGYLILEGVTNYNKIEKEDKVYTSGLGNLPKGLFVGQVSEIKEDSYGISNIVYVKISSLIDDINYVMVLTDD